MPGPTPQSHIMAQQMTKSNSQPNPMFSHANRLSAAGNSVLTTAAAGGQSVITDENPSCSTSPSANTCTNVLQSMMNSRVQRSSGLGEDMAHCAMNALNPNIFETISPNGSMVKDLQQKSDVRPSLNVSKSQNQAFVPGQADYLDTSSSTSVCLSQNDVQLQQNHNSLNYNGPSGLLRDTSQDVEVMADIRNSVPYGTNMDAQMLMPGNTEALLTKGMTGLEKDFPSNISSAAMLSNYENPKDAQQELSSSMVSHSQSFGVPDIAYNSIDSTINDSSFLNRSTWTPAPQFQRIRTYTKVYKRGAVGRSIDITRYSGYDELKQDLARRFGIEGQLEDRGRVGWKLVYVDHEDDVLLVGDDPWEEFVNCVRCIKILSPQEVQQMSLDGDFGNAVLTNGACSSSDNGMEGGFPRS